MTIFEDIKEGLLEAIDIEKGNKKLVEVKNDKLPARTFVVDATEKPDGDASELTYPVELIDRYMSLQRIQNAEDRDKEIEIQLREIKAMLKVYGVDTERLKLQAGNIKRKGV